MALKLVQIYHLLDNIFHIFYTKWILSAPHPYETQKNLLPIGRKELYDLNFTTLHFYSVGQNSSSAQGVKHIQSYRFTNPNPLSFFPSHFPCFPFYWSSLRVQLSPRRINVSSFSHMTWIAAHNNYRSSFTHLDSLRGRVEGLRAAWLALYDIIFTFKIFLNLKVHFTDSY